MTKSQNKGARLGLALLGAGMLLSAAPLAAQTGNPAADNAGEALSRNLRSLAENPKSLHALMGAGKAALELGDPQASITFFGRAEEQAPRDGRIKMWIGAALLQLQQAQGALKFFGEASNLGVPEAEVAGHRGLAWDLLGDNRRAQRDYKMALASKPDAETMRRLALSLAISGEREPALRVIEDQLLIRDRSAERTRAFVLALTGDTPAALRAIQISMPGAQSAAFTPFLERLPALTPAERALAVHLGHFPKHGRNLPVPPSNSYASNNVTAAGTPDRAQAALGARARSGQPQRGTQIAAAKAPVSRGQPRADRAAATAARQPEATPPAAKAPEPRRSAEPSTGATSQWAWSRGSGPRQRSAPAPTTPRQTATAPAVARQQVADAPQQAAPAPAASQQQIAAATPTQAEPLPMQATTVPGQQQFAAAQTSVLAESPPVSAPNQDGPPAAMVQAPAQSGPLQSALVQAAPLRIADAGPAAAAMLNAPGFSLAAPTPAPSAVQEVALAASSVAPMPQPAPSPVEESGASRLASVAALIATLPDAPPAPVASAQAPSVRAPAAKAPPPAKFETTPPAKTAAKKEPAAPAPGKTAAAAPATSRTGAAAAAKKDVPAKPAAKKEPPKPAEPSRHWVQVAGGADKAALPREFARLKAKAPKAFAAHGAWTTPLRATNRLLVGPFKSDDEAQSFVNELKKAELTAFAWTSEAGQKIEKLSAK
jgi:tetratricopeptide (TPR) repeat protein